MRRGLLVAGISALALVVAPGAMAAATAPTHAPKIKRFVIHGIYTREQRSQLVREGYDIGERAWADHVELYGTRSQANLLVGRGLQVSPTPDDFPPPDAAYHNYAEMVADVQAVAAAHPSTVHLISLG